ncbi:hypothetical protein NY547_10785 [Cnuibacter physcomitrellae]|uniref:hypothetical protein n=1 Tax=Cnuibacter physcomitrellae TaxID=1619308 RepID=UPI002175D2F9|nr:hypothetical protein [Cnuibacter physcomitrellae]MCS5497721.1 hypothetical protein [Cnuibacter physcomitrellae]
MRTSHSTRRSLSSRLAFIGTAVVLAVVPVLASAAAANADDSFAVTTPSQGQVDVPEYLPNTAQFAGAGLSAGNHVDVQYVTGDGSLHTAIYGGNTRADDGSWTAVANFDLLGVGQTQVISTVEEVAADGTVVQSRPLVFTLAVAPNPANPFTVTTPYVTETIDSATPTFTGTGEPGAEIVITYGARSLTTAEAGRGIVGADGTFSIVTDFSRLEPGAGTQAQGGVGAIFTETLNGEAVPGADQQSILFYFAEAPVPLIPLTLTVDPSSLTVADVTDPDKGVAITATGFSPNEGLTATLTGPDGVAVELSGAGGLFADDEDGSFADRLTLSGDVLTGEYTLTLSGNRSARIISTEFTVVANPVTPVTPGGNGGNAVPAPTGSGQLANTGFDAAPLGALAGGLLLAGLVVAALRRRAHV